jgi:hypothetical protein
MSRTTILLFLGLASCAPDPSAPSQVQAASQAAAPGPTAPQAPGTAAPQSPLRLCAEGTPTATLRFRVSDAAAVAGAPALPARLTFVGPAGPGAVLFPRTDAAPTELAVRKDVVYALRGAATITVPVGEFTVHASRGMEWSLATQAFRFEEGKSYEWEPKLVREVDTQGWVACDFHLHTLTHSGHGDANLEERVITLAGEGVEFAVATDHNHHTDYGPVMEVLGASGAFTAITGNEVSTPIGHFNAFPLDPARPPIDAKLTSGGELFKLVRAEPNAFGIVPIVQLNHPRLRDIDWFFHTGLDPVTGTSASPAWSDDFDTLEVFNSNAAQGYADSEAGPRDPDYVGCVLQDWFHLLNRGKRYGAVGNSDSHTVHFDFAGWPRNFVQCSATDPGKIDPREIAAALRDKRMFTTMGPFVEARYDDGRQMGPGVGAEAERQQPKLHVKVQAASWIDVDRVRVIVNGDELQVIDVPAERKPLRLDASLDMNLTEDAWIVLCVEGDDSLVPVLADTKVKHLPWAVTNPIWVDAEADGVWTSPWERALALAETFKTDAGANNKFGFLAPSSRALMVLAGAEGNKRWAGRLVRRALGETHRDAKLCAARAAEKLADPALADTLANAFRAEAADGYLRLALYRAMKACGAPDLPRAYSELVLGLRPDRRVVHQQELAKLFPGRWIDAWSVVGPFDSPGGAADLARADGPEAEPDLARTFPGRGGAEVAWKDATPLADGDGFVDLVAGKKKESEQAIFYGQTWIHAAAAREVVFALGTDDAGRLHVNGAQLVQDDGEHDAAARHYGKMKLEPGWNRVLLEVRNGRGASGFRMGVLDPDVRFGRKPD